MSRFGDSWTMLAVAYAVGIPLGTYFGLKVRRWWYRNMLLPKASWNQRRVLPRPDEIGYV